jgi:predicted transcriptional regulator
MADRIELEEEVLDLPKRAEIFSYVYRHPGVGRREIECKLGMAYETVRLHLRVLEKYEYIDSFKHNGNLYFFYINHRSRMRKMVASQTSDKLETTLKNTSGNNYAEA